MEIEPVCEDEMITIDIDAAGNELPPKHDKIIVVDADTIAFAACSVCEFEVEALSEEFLSDNELIELRAKKSWIEETFTYRDINIDEAILHAKGKMELILDRIGGKADNTELHFTSGRNFRYGLLEEAFPDNNEMWYKANRGKRKPAPVGLSEVKEGLSKHFKSMYHTEVEADDYVVMRKKLLKDNCILCVVDKDIYKNTFDYGQPHWNYYEAPWLKSPIKMRWIEMTEQEAIYNQYLQAITGDKSDNIPGLKGIGPAKAAKFIDEDMTEDELWVGLETAYLQHCKYVPEDKSPTDMAILNMQLVNMHALQPDGDIILYYPGKSIEGFNRYIITRDGRIYCKTRISKGRKNKGYWLDMSQREDGYVSIKLTNSKGERNNYYLHRLAAESFIDKPECWQELQVNHKDGNKSNNVVDNLEWVTSSQNVRHSLDTGLKGGLSKEAKINMNKPLLEGHKAVIKISEKDRLAIKGLHKSGKTMAEIAETYNVSQSCISRNLRR